MLYISCGVYAGYRDENIAFELMEQGKLEEFKKAIVADPQLPFSIADDFSLLGSALQEKKYDFAKFLIDRGVLYFHYRLGRNPLNWAAHSGSFDMVKYIVARIDKKYLNIYRYRLGGRGELPLGESVDYPNIVEFLLSAGAIPEKKDQTGRNALSYAVRISDNKNFVWSSERKKSTFLILNACKDKKKIIQDIDTLGNNAFHYACMYSNIEFVDYKYF